MFNRNLKVNLHICEHCNYHCLHCFAKFGCTKILDDENWKKIADNIISSGSVREINIAGGEPLLHPQMIDIVDYIQRADAEGGKKVTDMLQDVVAYADTNLEGANGLSMYCSYVYPDYKSSSHLFFCCNIQ